MDVCIVVSRFIKDGVCTGTFACYCSGEVSFSCPCEHFILVRYKLTFLQTYYGGLDETPLNAATALGLHCLPTSKNWTLC